MQVVTSEEYRQILDISVESLARLSGATDTEDVPDSQRSFKLKQQLGVLQSKPQAEQAKIHHELAAKHLPILAAKFKQSKGPLNAPMTLLNVISYTPYFVRFIGTPDGHGIAALQAKRMNESEVEHTDRDQIGEMCQFLATLLLLQGVNGIDADEKASLVKRLKKWERTFPGRLASTASSRSLAILNNEIGMRRALDQSRKTIIRGVEQCGADGCFRRRDSQTPGPELKQCARCKTAIYCGPEHQKQAWSTHKGLCFAPSF
ncbi:hypothetical protein JAAARDRAFT_41677 [Jaapia argillacea MUCL 33604]|uniref:MYND-type domain-containing protein n=1 Tax=Jaapia argillacea MUCL 33604 TaxID=933084 RepID=A0A067PIR2_9AGAM|nr:hypothetical protein JAAARDRAFT_41677 [Jaapia argillacea MUCL 33604]